MAKVLEELVIIKLSKIVKDDTVAIDVITKEQRELIEQTLSTLVDEVLNDPSIIVEIASLD